MSDHEQIYLTPELEAQVLEMAKLVDPEEARAFAKRSFATPEDEKFYFKIAVDFAQGKITKAEFDEGLKQVKFNSLEYALGKKKQPDYDDISKMQEESSRWLSLFHQAKAPFKHSFTTRFNVAPLFFYQTRQPRDKSGHLPVLKRDFQVENGFISTAAILPGKVEITKGSNKGEWQDYYPGAKEEILLEVLKKMATTGRATVLDSNMAVAFSIRDVRSELERVGRTASHAEILTSLQILRRSSFILKTEAGTTFEESYILSLGVKGEGKNQKVVVRFNTPTTAAIKEGDFRILDYETTIRASSMARKLIEKIVHTHKQLDAKGYNFELIQFLKGAGFEVGARLRESVRQLRAALDQITLAARTKENEKESVEIKKEIKDLEKAYVKALAAKSGYEEIRQQIENLKMRLNYPDKGKPRCKFTNYRIKPVYQDGGRKKVIDYVVTVYPTNVFTSEVRKANWEQSQFNKAK